MHESLQICGITAIFGLMCWAMLNASSGLLCAAIGFVAIEAIAQISHIQKCNCDEEQEEEDGEDEAEP